MTIGSLMSRMGTAEKLSIPQIQQAIKDGTLPAYVGIPMLQEKMKAAQAGQQPAQQQPSIAEQVMAQAQAEERQRGIPQLQSNLPVESMADGGIVAFAGGGSSEDDSEDDYDDSYDLAEANQAMDNAGLSRAIMARANPNKPAGSSLMSALPDGISSLVHRVSETFSRNAEAPASSKESAKNKHKYYDKIVAEASKLSLNPDFALRIAQKETGNLANPESAVSPAGALGVMQLMPKTARGLGVKDPMNPDENISGGVRYAKQMLDKYGDEKLAAMAYNWGPGNVDKWLKSGKGIEALPRETRQYATAFAEGGQVSHFWPGGLASTGGVPITSDYMNEAQQIAKDARLRLMREQARAAFTPAAEAAAAETPASLSPAAAQAGKTFGQRMLGNLGAAMGAPAAVTTAGGAGLTGLAGNYLNRLPDESLDTLSNDIGSDTGLAAAIMSQGRAAPPTAPVQASAAGAGRGTRGGPTAEEVKQANKVQALANRESAIGATQDAEDMAAGQAMATVKAPTKAAEKDETSSPMEEYLKMLKGGYEDVKKQKEEDRYLALLAAGLGIMGGTSPYASANIGAGAMHGISSLMESNKQRAAEKNALDKSYGQSLYRQALQENTAAQRDAQLQELIRSHDLTAEAARTRAGETAAQHAQTNLANAVKLVDSSFKSNIENIGKSDAEREAYVYAHPLVRKAAAAAGLDVSALSSQGQPKFTEKQQSLLDKWLK